MFIRVILTIVLCSFGRKTTCLHNSNQYLSAIYGEIPFCDENAANYRCLKEEEYMSDVCVNKIAGYYTSRIQNKSARQNYCSRDCVLQADGIREEKDASADINIDHSLNSNSSETENINSIINIVNEMNVILPELENKFKNILVHVATLPTHLGKNEDENKSEVNEPKSSVPELKSLSNWLYAWFQRSSGIDHSVNTQILQRRFQRLTKRKHEYYDNMKLELKNDECSYRYLLMPFVCICLELFIFWMIISKRDYDSMYEYED